MKELLAFLLPPATALAGMRISRLILSKKLDEEFKFGVRFALGLAVGMVVFTQSVLLGALLGPSLCGLLGWTILIWGAIEAVLLVPKLFVGFKQVRFQIGHLWLLLLAPVVLLLWAYGRLSVVDGTREFDAAAFWILKARILYLDHGKDFFALLHTSNLAYSHMDYPWLAPGLYSLLYGALGGINEFVIKVWPFWLLVTLCGAILSIGNVWRKPHPAPILMVLLLCYLPATEQYIQQEGATMPLLFGVSIAALLLVTALVRKSQLALAAGILALACCAATKLEGIVYALFWGVILSIFCWRYGWLKERLLWKAALVGACCLLPYFFVRIQKPVLYPEAHWLHEAATTPGMALRRIPQTLFLAFGYRYFNHAFFNWDSSDKDHLQYIGHWQGLNSFAGPELSLLPWMLLILVALTFWKKPAHRLALGALLAVVVGELFTLSSIISCLRPMQSSVIEVIGFTSEIVGRYFYPFLTACFLGTMAIWLLENTAKPVPVRKPADATDKSLELTPENSPNDSCTK